MTENQLNNGVFLSRLDIQKRELIVLRGFTTSQVRKREKLSDTPAYCFLKTDQQEQDIPVIFRIKESSNWIKPKIPKYSYLEVEGHFSNSDKERKSFTAISYQVLNSQPAKENLSQIEQNIN